MVTTVVAAIVAETIVAVVFVMSAVGAMVSSATVGAIVFPVSHSVVSVTMMKIVPAVIVVATSSVASPAMSSTVRDVHGGMTEIEIGAVIASIDSKMPATCAPVERTIEICCGLECRPLPVEQDITQVEIASCPVRTIDVISARHTHQIIQVNLVGCLILSIVEVELISHLVGEEESFPTSLLITHSFHRCCYRQHGY